MFKYLTAVLTLLIFFLSSLSSVSAQAPIRYYDWSSTLEKNQPTVLGLQARAATDSASSTATSLYKFHKYFLVANLTPETPFYLLKRVQENVSLMTTFNKVEKEKLKLSIAAERLEEAAKLAQKGSGFGMGFVSDGYRQTMNDLSQNLEKLQKQNVNVDELLKLVDQETAKHTVLLEKVLVLAPNSAKQTIEKAREASWEGADTVADLTGRPAVPPDAAARISALKSQGLLTEEEANKLIGVKTRSEARMEFKKYVQEGVVPESDFLRLNENLKTYYPAEFYQIHETKRFYALKKWEEQKPDETTLNRVQEFAKTYKTGETVPADLRKYWGSLVQLEELQSTIRPDLVDANLFKNNPEDYKKFQEIVERYKPRPEDVAFLNNYLANNPRMTDNLPPEYQRMKSLAEKFGAQCGPGMKWIQKVIGSQQTGVATGMCVPEGSADLEKPISVEEKNCNQVITSAKSPTGSCVVFANSCIPNGWVVVESCTETAPRVETTAIKPISCPSNSHFVPAYGSGNGYCVPNYTPIANSGTGNTDTPCPSGYHRNYQGGTCLPDFSEKFSSERGYLPPVTINPGGYPQPFYPAVQRCSNNQYWVPEPINPQGGYCMTNNYQPSSWNTSGSCPQGQYQGPGGICTAIDKSQEAWKCSQSGKFWDGKECRDSITSVTAVVCPNGQYFDSNSRTCVVSNSYNGAPNPQMGNCRTPGECYDWCKANPSSDKCPGFNPNQPRPGDNPTPSRESQEAACRAGGGVCVSWVNGACGCERPSSVSGCRPPNQGCEAGKWWNQQNCSCQNNGSYPSACTYPSEGCGSGYYWDSGSCMCKGTSSNSCGQGQYWNGSSCVTSPSGGSSGMSRESQEAACRAGGGTCVSWNNDACGCERPSSAPSGYGSCAQGQYWNGSICVNNPNPAAQSMSPEESCRIGPGCSWVNGVCQCQSSATTPQSTSQPAPNTPTPAPQENTPAPAPQENTPAPSTPAP